MAQQDADQGFPRRVSSGDQQTQVLDATAQGMKKGKKPPKPASSAAGSSRIPRRWVAVLVVLLVAAMVVSSGSLPVVAGPSMPGFLQSGPSVSVDPAGQDSTILNNSTTTTTNGTTGGTVVGTGSGAEGQVQTATVIEGCRGVTRNGTCVVQPGDRVVLAFHIVNTGDQPYGEDIAQRGMSMEFSGWPSGVSVEHRWDAGSRWYGAGEWVHATGWFWNFKEWDRQLDAGERVVPRLQLQVVESSVFHGELVYHSGSSRVVVPLKVVESVGERSQQRLGGGVVVVGDQSVVVGQEQSVDVGQEQVVSVNQSQEVEVSQEQEVSVNQSQGRQVETTHRSTTTRQWTSEPSVTTEPRDPTVESVCPRPTTSHEPSTSHESSCCCCCACCCTAVNGSMGYDE